MSLLCVSMVNRFKSVREDLPTNGWRFEYLLLTILQLGKPVKQYRPWEPSLVSIIKENCRQNWEMNKCCWYSIIFSGLLGFLLQIWDNVKKTQMKGKEAGGLISRFTISGLITNGADLIFYDFLSHLPHRPSLPPGAQSLGAPISLSDFPITTLEMGT